MKTTETRRELPSFLKNMLQKHGEKKHFLISEEQKLKQEIAQLSGGNDKTGLLEETKSRIENCKRGIAQLKMDYVDTIFKEMVDNQELKKIPIFVVEEYCKNIFPLLSFDQEVHELAQNTIFCSLSVGKEFPVLGIHHYELLLEYVKTTAKIKDQWKDLVFAWLNFQKLYRANSTHLNYIMNTEFWVTELLPLVLHTKENAHFLKSKNIATFFDEERRTRQIILEICEYLFCSPYKHLL